MGDADPSQVGGPNQAGAIISYPTHMTDDYHIPYNYKDTVNIEWFSYAANATETTMQIWYWTSAMDKNDKYKPLTKYVVPVNGTLSFDLNEVPKIDGGYYLGQWNLNFTRTDRAPVTGLTLSQPFNCSFDDSKAAVTYSPQGTVTGSPSSSATPSTSSSTSSSSASSASQTPSTTPSSDQSSQSNSNSVSNSASSIVSSATNSPTSGVLSANSAGAAQPSATAVASAGLSGGAIAGIIIAVLAALALGALGAFFFLRRKRAAAAGHDQAPPGYGQYPPGTPHSQYPPADAYKQPIAAYHNPGVPGISPGMAPMAPAMMAAGHYAPQQPQMKSQYVVQQQEQYYQQQAYAQQQQQAQAAMYAQHQPQAGGFVSELPSAHHRGGFDGVPAHQSETAPAFRQELPTERYT